MLPEGSYTLEVYSKGYRDKTLTVKVPSRALREVEVSLTPGVSKLSLPSTTTTEEPTQTMNIKYPYDTFYYPRRAFGDIVAKNRNIMAYDE